MIRRLTLACLLLYVGCGKDGGHPDSQSGGANGATGGSTGSGGARPGLGGGAGSPAGAAGSGGSAITGGAPGSGGVVETGGQPGSGGTIERGGTTGSTTGGTAGTAASGGAIGSGGNGGASSTAISSSLGAIYSGIPLLDTSGNLVNAHGPGFIKGGGLYYMVGEQRSGANDSYSGATINAEDTFTGVSMYSTPDFVSWTFVGTVVRPIAGTILSPPYYGERPKILYNASAKEYFIYIKMLNYVGNPPDYVGDYAILTSANIAGPYSYRGNLNLSGANDFEVFQDSDGSQYLARTGGKLYKFSSDGLTVGSSIVTVQGGEGPSLYKAGNIYFWQSSQGTYWHSNDNSYSSATSLTGPWTSHGYFCPSGSDTWQSQDSAVVPVTGTAGTTYVYVGDRWVNGALPASTLVMQPFTLSGSTESIPTYNPVWSLDVAAGTWKAVTPAGASINDSTVGTGLNQFTYSGVWSSVSLNGGFDGDAHVSSSAGATATVSFTGSQILLYSAYDESSGIMGVTLFDSAGVALTPELQVSLRYDAPAAGNYLVYASPVMPNGSYRLKVRVTGLKDWYSTGTKCTIDRVLIVGGS